MRFWFLTAILLMAGCGGGGGGSSGGGGGGSRANVILIVADDVGYGDLSCYGSHFQQKHSDGSFGPITPNLDALAASGLRFAQGYVTCPQCAPSRAAIFTGRYQERYGVEVNGPSLPLNQPTIAERLKPLGYSTGLIGKWHLGDAGAFLPQLRGFDEFYGFTGAANDYLPDSSGVVRGIVRGTAGDPTLHPADEMQYLTDGLTRESVSFINRHASGPFFLAATYSAVHEPLQATAEYLNRTDPSLSGDDMTRSAMLIALDDGVGKILAALKANGIDKNTIVFFISDNGGTLDAYNAPLRGSKLTLYEGGIREPYIAAGRGFPVGTVDSGRVVSGLDFSPTILRIAGGNPDSASDGLDLQGAATHSALYYRFPLSGVVRKAARVGNMVLKGEGSFSELYDVVADIHEDNNLFKSRPDDVARISGLWDAWNASLPPVGKAAIVQQANSHSVRQSKGTKI